MNPQPQAGNELFPQAEIPFNLVAETAGTGRNLTERNRTAAAKRQAETSQQNLFDQPKETDHAHA